MPPMRLEDALRVVLLMRTGDEANMTAPASAGWQVCIEVKGVSLEELRDAARPWTSFQISRYGDGATTAAVCNVGLARSAEADYASVGCPFGRVPASSL